MSLGSHILLKIVSENQFSGKTYFYTIASRVRAVGAVQRRKGSEWEILGNLEHGTSYAVKPRRYEGFMSKKRKWPLKGWHKR